MEYIFFISFVVLPPNNIVSHLLLILLIPDQSTHLSYAKF